MRFNDNDYLKAFPREEKTIPAVPTQPKKIVKDEPGDVLDTGGDEKPKTPEPDPDPTDTEVIDGA